MAAKTATRLDKGQGVIRAFLFTDIDDGDTFVGPVAPGRFWINNNTDGVVVSATQSSGTYTFTVASAGTNKNVTLFILD